MKILWDDEKSKKLIALRGLAMEEFATLILEKKYTAILKNPSREEQKIFIIPYRDYTYVVPFLLDGEQNIVLKTVFQAENTIKYTGGRNHESKT